MILITFLKVYKRNNENKKTFKLKTYIQYVYFGKKQSI